ncbi:hypothetical protein RND81_07G103100 [Saponaria officinalis]|uniref:Uncharacterized protein n=1 Tax=Saponaria officinalis TaxID=3572 RepID=A0AAW1JSR4_SAPOF
MDHILYIKQVINQLSVFKLGFFCKERKGPWRDGSGQGRMMVAGDGGGSWEGERRSRTAGYRGRGWGEDERSKVAVGEGDGRARERIGATGGEGGWAAKGWWCVVGWVLYSCFFIFYFLINIISVILV